MCVENFSILGLRIRPDRDLKAFHCVFSFIDYSFHGVLNVYRVSALLWHDELLEDVTHVLAFKRRNYLDFSLVP